MTAIVLQFRSDTEKAKSAMAQLATSVASNMGSIASVMGSTALTTASATSVMGTGFGNAALAAGRFALQYRLLLGTLGIVGLAIAKSAGDLQELVTIGDKAAAVRLSPETFQAFTREAEKSRIAIKDAEAALKAFNTANKLGFDPANETRPNQPSPLGKYLEDLKLIQRELQDSTALDRFLNAPDQNAKLRATVDIIKELQASGRDFAATGFAEKAFGGAGEKIAQEIRKGKFEMEGLVAEGKAAGLIFDNELVERATELRNRLNAAAREIGDNLTPLMRGSVDVALALGGAFTTAAEAAASVARAVSGITAAIGGAVSAAAKLIQALGTAANAAKAAAGGANFNISAEDVPELQNRVADLDKQIAGIRSRTAPSRVNEPNVDLDRLISERQNTLNRLATAPSLPSQNVPVPDAEQPRNVIVPLPQQRPANLGEGRTPRGGGGSADAEEPDKRLKEIETFIKALEKANRLAEAELATAGKSNAEKEKAAALARIGSDLTDEQRLKIEQLAESTAKFRDKQKEVEEAIRRTAEAGQFMGNVISDALSDAIFNGTKLSQVAQNLARSLGSTALKGLLTGQGPFGGGGSGGGLLGGLFSSLVRGFGVANVGAPLNIIPGAAVGSDNILRGGLANIHAGEMIIPAGPAAALRAGRGGGGGGVTVVNNNDFRGSDPSMRAYLEQRIAVSESRTVAAARAAIAQDRRNGRLS